METLTLDERERIVDSALKIQSVRRSLSQVGENKIPSGREIANCLKTVDHNLRAALGYVRHPRPDESVDHRRNTIPDSFVESTDETPLPGVKPPAPAEEIE